MNVVILFLALSFASLNAEEVDQTRYILKVYCDYKINILNRDLLMCPLSYEEGQKHAYEDILHKFGEENIVGYPIGEDF